MLNFNQSKSNCTGCAACYSACPIKCIKMVPDEAGFLYPISGTDCIHCGICEKVCPSFREKKTSEFTKRVFVGVSQNNQIWQKSSSGGAFSEICNVWDEDDNCLICGAAWNGLDVEHICVYGKSNISPLRKSKYVASSVNNCFIEIKKQLQDGGKAVFCGTPCQVAGLKSFLGKEYDNLLLIDFVCHGVGAPNVFKDCVSLLEKQFNFNVNSYEFRSKPNRKVFYSRYISCAHGDRKDVFLENDQYMQLFLNQTCLKESCGKNCKYRSENREGDITISDFNGDLKVFPELRSKGKNFSSMIANDGKGLSILQQLNNKMKMFESSVDEVKKTNPLFFTQTWFSTERDGFFCDYISDRNNLKKYVKPARVSPSYLKRRAFFILPESIRKVLLKMKGV